MVWVTWHFSDVATQLSGQGIEVAEQHRKASIRPDLQILSGMNYTEDYHEIVVPIRNGGSGTALSVRALVAYDGKLREAEHLFDPIDEPVFGDEKVLRNPPGSQQDLFTLASTKARDWIGSGDIVQFRFNPWLDVEKPPGVPRGNREFTIFLSYFDVDQNEYLAISKLPIGGRTGLILVTKREGKLNDTLLSLSSPLDVYESTVYDDVTLRKPGGFFIGMDSL